MTAKMDEQAQAKLFNTMNLMKSRSNSKAAYDAFLPQEDLEGLGGNFEHEGFGTKSVLE